MAAPKTEQGRRKWIAAIKAAHARRKRLGLTNSNKGRKQDPRVVAKRSAAIRKVYEDPAKRKRLSDIAKARGYGKWMTGRKAYPGFVASAKARKGKTYAEIYGKERAEEEARKRRESNRKRWEGKVLRQRDRHAGCAEYERWRTAVYKRDNYTCQMCDVRGGTLNAHHIKGWAKYPHLRFVVSNGITLCEGCHDILHFGWRRH